VTVRMTPVQSKTLALVLLFAVLLAIYAGIVSPAISLYRANDATIGQLQQRVFHYLQLTQRAKQLEDKKKHLLSLQSANYYLSSNTESLAAAEIQALIKKLTERANGRLVSTQPLPTPRNGLFQEIKIQVRLQGSSETLQTVLYELETGTPSLLIRNLSIGQEFRTRTRRSVDAVQQAADALNISFDLIGFMRVKTT
jgi:general secretion pathway protein M